jgi:hypothetical protein
VKFVPGSPLGINGDDGDLFCGVGSGGSNCILMQDVAERGGGGGSKGGKGGESKAVVVGGDEEEDEVSRGRLQ